MFKYLVDCPHVYDVLALSHIFFKFSLPDFSIFIEQLPQLIATFPYHPLRQTTTIFSNHS